MSDMEENFSHDMSWGGLISGQYGRALAVVSLAVWLHAGDSLIVATMLPSIVAEVGGEHMISWSFILYVLASVIAGATSALLTMSFGLRVPMFWAALLFGLGCLISALAMSMPVVLLGRLLQGAGGGVLVSLGFIAARVLFPSHLLPKVMAATSTLWGASAFLGPLLGGLFVEYASWRWGFAAFAIQAIALALFVRSQKIPADQMSETGETSEASETSGPLGAKRSVPWLGLAVLSLSVLCIAMASINVRPVQSSAFILAGLALAVLFLKVDARAGASRMLPARPFDLRTPVGAALLMLACFCSATVTNSVYGTLLLTRLHGVSALVAGYVLACAAFGWSITAFVVNSSAEEKDAKMIGIGMTAVATSLVAFSFLYPVGPVWILAMIAGLSGAGFGMSWTFILRRTTSLVEEAEIPRVTAAITTVQRVGYAFGAAYIGLVGNALGFEETAEPIALGELARSLFMACFPFVLLGLLATWQFVKPGHVSS
ncbi:MFS transporter [Cohaesibacter gelatinilyticus]|uniref:Predicted arabinose efflux permease, MFS family n=1 Tax=Cohaesibacter gelatinilyticus TaxID=372072 RepID=A0A285PH61_9HYPH|nr:MFS transporter [Cohaesibacter gelatinilyticus]SNZ19476.1 Predicted arabinose efflux permease, MFS family [Cohaesibacter gelatinilyticus]